MLKSTRLIQNIPPSTLQGVFGGYTPNSALVLYRNNNTQQIRSAASSSATGAAPSSSSSNSNASGKIPDPSGAIFQQKIYHYSSMGVAALLPVSLMLPSSELTLVTDCALGVIIPAHFYLGMNSVVNDYIYSVFPKYLVKALVAGTSIVLFTGIVFIAKKSGLGATVRALWVK
ncbi:succinate dehydrogenase [Heterostelium album PN500]|uniref:Succinate dehydrogenase [ubiquinone] cytochrome b small subunit n=1 Tax=Heterostelium pallidum (strain ATCC 26659 / Pp 5 / PN500) TaxID=670386 RepID=D3BI60_HETP5|nr:succinate dehydrogenase [Heterostelium album PN500]EFA78960.1 succinate dehydrogenase [Heterostelium album PN500]|eukprot:XP_020431084.1 succinate dehydrogenase [Heterostelium album PN500]